jgi:hypothetical protein
MTYTGDVKIIQLSDDSFDIFFENGQSTMTNGFETMVIFAVFGEDNWQNELTQNESEKMKSEFPEVIRRNVVTDKTKNDGTKAIEKALKFMLTEKMCKSIVVTGEILSVYGIVWLIEIEALTDKTLKYFINWEKGELTAGLVT